MGLINAENYYYYYCPFNVHVSPFTGNGLIRRHVDGLIAFLHSLLFTTLPSLRLSEDKSCFRAIFSLGDRVDKCQ